jgi:hypothetical protein
MTPDVRLRPVAPPSVARRDWLAARRVAEVLSWVVAWSILTTGPCRPYDLFLRNVRENTIPQLGLASTRYF